MQLQFNFKDINVEEELVPVILNEVPIEGYSISKSGEVYSHWKQTRKLNANNGFDLCCDLNYKKLLKPRVINKYLYVDINFAEGTFEYQYRNKHGSPRQSITCSLHKLVMDSWKPFDEYLPSEIDPIDYQNSPESIKNMLKQLFIINHIDHDKFNNHIDNLERVTHKQNSRCAKQHYSSVNKE